MVRIKNTLTGVAVAALALTTLAACGSEDGATSSEAPESPFSTCAARSGKTWSAGR